MTRDEYLRELDSAGRELKQSGERFVAAANPLNQLRFGVAHDWKWWLPGASLAGFAMARLLRHPRSANAGRQEPAATGAAFWVPLVLKFLPATAAQLVPLILSLRSGRKP